jgi:predicted nucleic acid-binding protein
VDASAAVEWLLQLSGAGRVAEKLFLAASDLHAPHLLDVEVTQVLRREVAAGSLAPTRAFEGLQDFLDLPITRHPHEPFLWRIWELRQNLSAYDAAYVALAETLGATLLTCDAKIAGASGHDAQVEVV